MTLKLPIEKQPPVILVADDDPTIRHLIRSSLTHDGGSPYQIEELGSNSDILSVIQHEKPDCLVLADNLSQVNYLQLLEIIKVSGLAKDMAIIILTSHEDVYTALKVMKTGAQDYIDKQHLSPDYLESVIQDALEQKRLANEQVVAQSEKLFRSMAEASPVLIMTCDKEAKLTYFNRAMSEYTGTSLHDAIRQGWETLMHPEDAEAWRRLKLHGKAAHQTMFMELRLLHYTGTYRWAIMSGAPQYNAEGEFTGFMDSMMDIHERKLMEIELYKAKAQAEDANRKKSEFLSMMSHELRTPLNAIIGYSRMVELGMSGPIQEKQRQYLEKVGISAHHLLDLINDLLDISRIEQGNIKVSIQDFKLNPVLEEVKDMMQQFADQKKVFLTFELDPKLDSVKADPVRFRQILLNLINNAIKFNKLDGSVWVRIFPTADARYLVGEVEDTGIGISSNKLPEIFKPFYQVDSSLSRIQEGTGLGLALVKHLVELHGGEVEVESKESLGTIFRFSLPQ